MISSQDREFARAYVDYKQKHRIDYHSNEFLYGHVGPWPQPSFDHPLAQPPQILNIPRPEAADWERYVSAYYDRNGRTYGADAAGYAGKTLLDIGYKGYADVDDETFAVLIAEGLFSKYLCELDAQDRKLFANFLSDEDRFEYLKSDFSCMQAIGTPWGFGDGEDGTNNPQYVLPSIVLVKRPRTAASAAPSYDYSVVAVAVCKYDVTTAGGFDWQGFSPDLVFTKGDDQVWWLAKLFALQGAIHRINLIDHTKVHFPNDTVNAVTKSALPRWHWLHKLLVPHFFLTLPVNDAVLEADRSIISRETWYPWNPFAGKGEEVRKLLAYAWLGSPDGNSSFPGFAFSDAPGSGIDANDPTKTIKTFIGLRASRYAKFLEDYFGVVLNYTTAMVDTMLGAARWTARPEAVGLERLEIRKWACQISRLLPGFPDENEILVPGKLERVLAMIIWNAAIVHSSDHTLLHQMFEQNGKVPMPYVLRLPAPKGKTLPDSSLKQTLSASNQVAWDAVVKKLAGSLGLKGIPLVAYLGDWAAPYAPHGKVPLCWPSDIAYARLADLLFYLPHNTVTLYNVGYDWLDAPELAAHWPKERPLLTKEEAAALDKQVGDFKNALLAADQAYYPAGQPAKWGNLPLLKLPRVKDDDKINPVTDCFGSSIQY